MRRLLITVVVSLATATAVLFGFRGVRRHVRQGAEQAEAALKTVKAPEVNVSIDINVTDILAAAAGGAFAAQRLHRRKKA